MKKSFAVSAALWSLGSGLWIAAVGVGAIANGEPLYKTKVYLTGVPSNGTAPGAAMLYTFDHASGQYTSGASGECLLAYNEAQCGNQYNFAVVIKNEPGTDPTRLKGTISTRKSDTEPYLDFDANCATRGDPDVDAEGNLYFICSTVQATP